MLTETARRTRIIEDEWGRHVVLWDGLQHGIPHFVLKDAEDHATRIETAPEWWDARWREHNGLEVVS